jgi:thiamine-phosphate pyrophosphorylase
MVTDADRAARLILAIDAGEGARERLAAALRVAEVACAIIRQPTGRAVEPSSVRTLIEALRKQGSAALIEDDAALARTLRADGLHLSFAEKLEANYAQARELLGGRAMIGFDAGRSRHIAMTVAEAGADYVAFGVRSDGASDVSVVEARLALVEWWAEIFEVPSVALDVTAADDAYELACAGADFVSLDLGAGLSAADAAERTRLWREALMDGSARRVTA